MDQLKDEALAAAEFREVPCAILELGGDGKTPQFLWAIGLSDLLMLRSGGENSMLAASN